MELSDFEKHIALAQFTSFKIGGPADYFYRAKTSEDAVSAIMVARREQIACTLLSGGTNVLINDQGVRGLVVKMENNAITIAGLTVRAESGASMAVMATNTVNSGLVGLEWGIGIPGKLGGAIRGNAGCFGRDISMNLKRVQVLYEQDDAVWMDAKQCQFEYRDSLFKRHPEWVILCGEFILEPGDQKEGIKKLREYTQYRQEKQPQGVASAGSVFKNPKIEEVSDEVRTSAQQADMIRNERIPAGWLIDLLGLKGKTIGNVQVSERHGNFFINLGGGTAEQMVMLMSYVKQQVRDQLGVQLYEEIQYIGF